MRDARMSDSERAEISRLLEANHRVFYAFWSMASITFTDDAAYCPTAMVMLPRRKPPSMVINRQLWQSFNAEQRVFLITHECLHSILDHGMRNGRAEVPQATAADVNIAQDITINEMSESVFGISRHKLPDWRRYCWIETVFKDDAPNIKRDQSFVYYLAKIAGRPHNTPDTVDDHGGFADEWEPEEDEAEVEDDGTMDAILNELSDEELEKLHEAIGRGTGGSIGRALLKRQEAKKLNFDKIVQGLKASALARKTSENDTYVREHRRFISLGDELILPGPHEKRSLQQGKLKTAVFLDVSGSCIVYAPVFLSVLEAFNKEREYFDVRAFTFDTRVRDYNVGDPFPEGGGTSFHIIEKKLQALKKDKKNPMRYPDCVVVISDGYGNIVKPEMPSRWIWLLTDAHTTTCFPDSCRSFLIRNVSFGGKSTDVL